jgi:DNA-binding Lrp family transcriptional regulator
VLPSSTSVLDRVIELSLPRKRPGRRYRQYKRQLLRILVSADANVVDTLLMLPTGIDALDARLIRAMCDTPRAGVMELARQLGVARGTVQARLDKLQQRGIISGFDPDLNLRAMGYEVLAFVSLEIAQGRLDDVCRHLCEIPEVLEVHTVTGPGDLHCRVVAHTNDHLQAVINRILETPGIDRSTTQIALTEQLRHRVLPLVELAIDDHGVAGAAS